MEQDAITRPHKIENAIKLLYITMGIGIIRGIFEASALPENVPLIMMIVTFVITFGILWFFIFMISRGRNWARIVFLVLLVIGVPLSIQPLMESLNTVPISGLLGVAQFLMQIVAVVFLFQKPSSNWFKIIRANKQQGT